MGRRLIYVVIILLIIVFILNGCTKPASPPEGPKEEHAIENNPMDEEKEFKETKEPKGDKIVLKDPVMNPLTGLMVERDNLYPRPVGIMFGNSRQERPQSGIDGADIVYEMLAEGGITRLFGIYMSEIREKIGPVRSARHYNLDFLMPYNGIFIYFGGSDRLWAEIPKFKINGINGIYDGYTYWRSLDRKAPYNAYTSTLRIMNRAKDLKFWNKVEIPQKHDFYEEYTVPVGNEGNVVKIVYPINNHRVKFEFDIEANNYLRFVNDGPHIDKETEKQLTADNIVILYIKSYPIPGDKEGRLEMETVGSGNGHLLTAGKEVPIKWSKKSRSGPMELTYLDGNKIYLNPGKTWFQIVPLNASITISKGE